jgi:hypothetical protein
MVDPSGFSSESGVSISLEDIYDILSDSEDAAKLLAAGVRFEIRGDKIVIFGKNAIMQEIDIPQRIINESNVLKYTNIAQYSDIVTSLSKAFSDIDKSDILVAALSIGEETYSDVQSVKSTEGKAKVGAADIAFGVGGTVLSTAAAAIGSASAGAIMGATIGSVVPGVGTIIGFFISMG